MIYEETTPLRGPSTGSPDRWMDVARTYESMRLSDVSLFADTVHELCDQLYIRPEVVMAVAMLTTGRWRSYGWNTRCNFYGRTATSDETDKNFGNGSRAARGLLVHIWLLLSGRELPAELSSHRSLCMSWETSIDAGLEGSVTTIGDLARCFGVPWEALDNIINDDLPFILKE